MVSDLVTKGLTIKTTLGRQILSIVMLHYVALYCVVLYCIVLQLWPVVLELATEKLITTVVALSKVVQVDSAQNKSKNLQLTISLSVRIRQLDILTLSGRKLLIMKRITINANI